MNLILSVRSKNAAQLGILRVIKTSEELVFPDSSLI